MRDMEMSQYLDMFIEESREHLQAINENLLVLENDPANVNTVHEIFRSAHTLKGMSATMGFEDMASLTHEMENVLDQVRNQKMSVNPGMMDILFQCVDLLEGMVHSISNHGDGRLDVTSVVVGLKRILSGEDALPVASPSENGSIEEIDHVGLIFDEYELTIIKQSIEGGYSVFSIQTEIGPECVLKAVRAYMVYNGLESYGEIIKCVPSVEEIEEEKMDNVFDIVLITQKSIEEIEKFVLDVSEIQSVKIKPVHLGQLSKADTETETETHTEKETPALEKEPAQVTGQVVGGADKSSPVQKKSTSSKTIRVDIERLDILMNLFSELVIDRGRLEQLSKELHHGPLTETVEHMNRISGDLQNIILTMRMIPLEQVFNRFPRMVRDLSKELKKNIDLVVEGAETELDRTLIDEIGDPLVHLLRNSIDHGIENPDERVKGGKPETGKILLRAYHGGNHVFIEVRDDGKGIDRERVLKKAIEKGIVSEQQKGTLSDKQVFELLFASGLSTAEKISDISGRGVGLDVVKTKLEFLGGSVTVDSTPGKGSVFLIQLPLTLSIISSMLVKVGEEMYAVPLSSIIETAVFKKEDIMRVHQQDVIDFRGRVVPLVNLKKIFKLPNEGLGDYEDISVLIIRKGDKMAGLVVNSFIGQQEIVLKSLGKYLSNVFAISGATILGNGQVALIIDCNQLIQ